MANYLYGHIPRNGETPTHTINGVDYVGVVLELLGYDEQKYPFLILRWLSPSSPNILYADALNGRPHCDRLDDGTYILCFGDASEKIHTNTLMSGESGINGLTRWSTYNFSSNQKVCDVDDDIFYTNFDIYNEDGTLYLAASDPIPVGSAPEVEPKSFMAGSWMGQIVKYYGIGV